jgi:alpha-amylase
MIDATKRWRSCSPLRSWTKRYGAAFLTVAAGICIAEHVIAEDVSQPAILQMFEARWDTIEERMADIFQAGYGQMWLPPPERADGGINPVGYSVFDRFDLGSPRNETTYGTKTGLKATIDAAHNASVKMYTDFVPNHNGFSNKNTPGFAAAGGYPGFVLSTPSDQNGDFHDPSISYTTDPVNGSLFGLLDIAQEKNYQYYRHPTTAGNPDNIPAGTVYNKVDPNNAQYYVDQGLGGVALNDPNTGGAFTRYQFNLNNPLAGDPIKENATGLLMRNMQWMIQVMGVDGFRVDAARHMPTWFFNYLDNAVFRTSLHTNFDGTIEPIYMFSEVADGYSPNVQPYIRRDLPNKYGISTSETTVKGNRDALDFPLFWAMVGNLSGNGLQNNWHNLRNAALDVNDDGLHNGSQGVTFVDSHDKHDDGQGNPSRPYLYKVAYAYTLMMPGNAEVYYNAREFGERSDSFPYDIGGTSNPMSNDALGGYFGGDVAKLVSIRSAYGRGDFRERWIDEAFGDTNGNGYQDSNIYIFERSKELVVGLNSRLDPGYDERNPVQTDFAANTYLVELTGNADNATVDPGGNIYHTLKVNASGQVKMRVPRNASHGLGYVIYGLPAPEGTMSLSNISQVLAGGTPTADTSGTTRLNSIDVITANSFTVQLNTTPVTLPPPEGETNPVRDVHADGDYAVVRIDGGMDLNSSGGVDNTTLTSTGYGFENFTTTNSPGFVWSNGANVGTGYGTYAQAIDATQLSEGRHYITVRAYRHRNSGTGGDGGPAVFTDFKRTIYVDRLPPNSAVTSFAPYASDPNNPNNRDLIVRSVDGTANNVHFLLDLPANLTNSQILAMLSGSTQGNYYDRDGFYRGYNGVTDGNHVVTVVSYEPTGNLNVQRFSGWYTDTNIGLGFGDMNSSGLYTTSDIRCSGACSNNSVEDVLYSQNNKFRAAFDVNGDGLGDDRDLFLLGNELVSRGAGQTVLDSYTDLLLHRADVNGSNVSDTTDVTALYASFGTSSWTMDLNVDGAVNALDVSTMIVQLFRTRMGDFNVDGVVDARDYSIMRKRLGGAGTYTQGDADLDGDVDNADADIWRSNFGFVRQPLSPGAGSSSLAAVPEPANILLLLIGCSLTLGVRNTSHRRRILRACNNTVGGLSQFCGVFGAKWDCPLL